MGSAMAIDVKLDRILVPVDGSNHAAEAVDIASDTAKRRGASLVLIHVTEDFTKRAIPDHLRQFARIERLDVEQMMRAVANKLLDAAKARAAENDVDEIETVPDSGDPGDAIVNYVKAKDIDLIVMGRRGVSSLESMMFGSVSLKVSQLADCAVLTVK